MPALGPRPRTTDLRKWRAVAVTKLPCLAHSASPPAAGRGCHALAYPSLAGVYKVLGWTPERHSETGLAREHPVDGTEHAQGKDALERSEPRS